MCCSRRGAGLGGGGLMSLGLTIVGDITEPKLRPQIIAGMSSIGAVASLFGPLVGGALADSDTSGWRWIFYINLPIGGLAVFMTAIAMRKFELPAADLPVDVLGSLWIVCGCSCIILFVLWGGSPTGFAWDSVTIILLIVFAVRALPRADACACLAWRTAALPCHARSRRVTARAPRRSFSLRFSCGRRGQLRCGGGGGMLTPWRAAATRFRSWI